MPYWNRRSSTPRAAPEGENLLRRTALTQSATEHAGVAIPPISVAARRCVGWYGALRQSVGASALLHHRQHRERLRLLTGAIRSELRALAVRHQPGLDDRSEERRVGKECR